MHFGISEGKGGLKHGSRPWLGMDIFWNCPLLQSHQASQQINFGRVRDQPGFPASKARFVYHHICLDFK